MKPDHDWKRREVGCQSNLAETRDASVQVDLLTQQFSRRCSGGCGTQWQCVSIKADEPLGGDLLQHINRSLPQTAGSPAFYLLYPTFLPTMPLFSKSESVEPLHCCSLPSMLQCSASSTEGGMCSAPSPADVLAVPPGLIAPLSPSLSEEEEEEEQEKKEEECLSEQENNKCSSAGQLTLKAKKRKKVSHASRTKSQPTDSLTNHRAGKPPPSRRSLCSPAHQKTSLMEDDQNKMSKTKQQEEKHQGRKPSAGVQHSPAEGGVKPKTDASEQARRPRRTMVHPPIRYRQDYEEQSHGLSSANRSRERRAELKKKQIMMRRTHQQEEMKLDQVSGGQTDSSRMESENRGVERWRQHCQVCGLSFTTWASLQLHLSVHRKGWMFSCQLCNRRFSHSSSLHTHCHTHHSSYKAGCHGSKIRAKLREAETGDGKEKWKEEEVEQVEKLPRFPEPDWSSQKHISRSACWWVDYKALKKRSSQKRKRVQQEDGLMEWKKKRFRMESGEVGVKRVCVGKITRVQEVEQPQRPRRRMVGPPIRYLLESEEVSHGAIMTNKTSQYGDKIKHGVRAQKEVIEGGASQVINRLEDMERPSGLITTKGLTSHMIAEGKAKDGIEINDKKPQRPQRKMVGPPIRYLLQTEEPPHSLVTTNHSLEHKAKQWRGGPKMASSDAGGGTLKMIDSSKAVDEQKDHITSEKETAHTVSKENREEHQRPRRKMVRPPIRYLQELKELSHVIATPKNTESDIGQSLGSPKKVIGDVEGGALQMIDSPKDVARETGHIVLKEKEEEDGRRIHCEGNEKPHRPGRKMVGPPIRYLLQIPFIEEKSHGIVTTNHNAENKIGQTSGRTKKVVSVSDAGGGASEMFDRPTDVATQAGHIVLKEKREEEDRGRIHCEGNEKVMEQPQRPRRNMVGPPIRYLLESEELSHSSVITSQKTENKPKQSVEKPKQVEGRSDAKGVSSTTIIDRSEAVDRQTCHMTTDRKAVHLVSKEKREEESDAEGVSSEMIDRSEVVDRETHHMVSKEEREEEHQRPRRKMVGPPIRYLLESEELSHGAVATNQSTVNCPGKPTPTDGESDAEGVSSQMIDRSEVVDRETHHMVSKEEREEEHQRPRRKMVGPPIRYLLESEELSHGAVATNQSTVNCPGKPTDGESDAEGVSSEMIDRSEVVDRETHHMVSKEEGEEPHRPGRKMVDPPISYLLQTPFIKQQSHGIVTTSHSAENKIGQSLGRPKKVASVSESGDRTSEMNDRPKDVTKQTGYIVLKEKRGAEDGERILEGNEKVEEQPQRPRSITIDPPIRCLVESKKLSHGFVTAYHNTEINIGQSSGRSKKVVNESATEMIDRPEGVARQIGYTVSKKETEEDEKRVDGEGNEKVEEQTLRPRRKSVGPPIRYLLESEEPSHNAENKSKQNVERLKQAESKSGADDGVSRIIDRPEVVDGWKSHMITEKVKSHMDFKKENNEEPHRSRKMVDPPVRYLLQSEELSHRVVTTSYNAEIDIGQDLERSNEVVSDSDDVGGALEMIDSSVEKGHMVLDKETWTYLAYRDPQSGEVTIILPCFVRLQRIL
ncbi:uncharacterized protein LOC121628729 isoform X2 [Melanotaenia boesemani]|uniref:uncharacterized protein LOC121628729 isoform X2 n=1 Tax=Melanotaenia boesemani TaxID=1250792 RepID=UPI001C050B42|nr:uncharacterized protein LOC121628729 isoform X2 [Melanotaenia boesemani]